MAALERSKGKYSIFFYYSAILCGKNLQLLYFFIKKLLVNDNMIYNISHL